MNTTQQGNEALSTQEGNKVIARFMQKKWVENEYNKNGFHDEDYIGGFEYHTSWDWLMPVVEKIEATDLFQVIIKTQFVRIEYYNPFNPKTIAVHGIPPNTKIEAVRLCTIDFINWYNKNKTND